MRLIGNLQSEDDVRRLCHFLKKKGIETSFDGSFDAATGHMSYQLWGYEEDQILDAQREFQAFLSDPSNAMYDLPVSAPSHPDEEPVLREMPPSQNSFTPLTAFIIALCGFIFLLNWSEETTTNQTRNLSFFTQVQQSLFYDIPLPFQKIDEFIETHDLKADQKTLPVQVANEFQSIQEMPYFRGFYDWVSLKIQGEDASTAEGPMFEKIRQGQVWRVFTPAILHVGFLHILFNMISAWILSRPIERKVGIFRLFLLILITGIGSNTAQYLMGGAFFLGYSGVVMGLAGFTWMREKLAPWEGYPLQKSTIWFLLIYVGAMALIQVASFMMQLSFGSGFSPNIANTAHITGGLLGALLGRFSLFAERLR